MRVLVIAASAALLPALLLLLRPARLRRPPLDVVVSRPESQRSASASRAGSSAAAAWGSGAAAANLGAAATAVAIAAKPLHRAPPRRLNLRKRAHHSRPGQTLGIVALLRA